MMIFLLYLMGSLVLTGASLAAFLRQPSAINLSFLAASLLFVAGGILGLVSAHP